MYNSDVEFLKPELLNGSSDTTDFQVKFRKKFVMYTGETPVSEKGPVEQHAVIFSSIPARLCPGH